MVKVVGVRFKKAGKVYYFDPGEARLSVGDRVVVETARGLELGEVAIRPKEVPEDDLAQPLRKVIRAATPEDLSTHKSQAAQAREAYDVGQAKINAHQLPMKLVDVEYTFDRSKLIFYFTAENRVDFRELVKELASHFRTRIELRQIGVRDEAKHLGGYGVCGRPLCCSTWITDFEPVSIRHAKEQDLSLNPNKISGVCGRLKCCLRFEVDAYRHIRSELPKVGEIVLTKRGKGKVVDVLIMKESVIVQLSESGERLEVTAKELRGSRNERVGA